MANDIVWDDEQPSSNASGVVWDDERPAQQPKPENTMGQELKRQGGLFLRNAISAAASPAVLLDTVQAKASDALTGKHIGGTLGQDLQARLTGLGIPEPQRGIEHFTQGVADTAPAFALPATLPTQVLGNAALASAQAKPGEEVGQAALGGALGAGGHALTRAVSGLVRPTEAARSLMDRGVALTPGQAAGPGTYTQRFENWAASNPVAGVPVRNAQRRALAESNRAAAQTVASLVDDKVKLGLPPSEAIEQTRDAISAAYHKSLDGMSWPASGLQTDLQASMAHLPNDLPLTPEKTLRQIDTYLSNRLGPWVKKGGDLTGEQLKQVDAELGQMARGLANSPNPTDKVQAAAWREVQSYVRNAMEHASATPEQAELLSKANGAYRQLLVLEKARLPGDETFTPRRLRMALERAKVKGTPLNAVSQEMEATLPNTFPDSGTAERLMANLLPGMLFAGGAGASSLGWDTLGVGAMAAGALGSRPGARALVGALPGQQALANALRQFQRAVPAAVATDESR